MQIAINLQKKVESHDKDEWGIATVSKLHAKFYQSTLIIKRSNGRRSYPVTHMCLKGQD